jgi:hypothetical protein
VPCPLSGKIALITHPDLVDLTVPAVRVDNIRQHDVIVINPRFSFVEQLGAVMTLVTSEDRGRVVTDVACGCEVMARAVGV